MNVDNARKFARDSAATGASGIDNLTDDARHRRLQPSEPNRGVVDEAKRKKVELLLVLLLLLFLVLVLLVIDVALR